MYIGFTFSIIRNKTHFKVCYNGPNFVMIIMTTGSCTSVNRPTKYKRTCSVWVKLFANWFCALHASIDQHIWSIELIAFETAPKLL